MNKEHNCRVDNNNNFFLMEKLVLCNMVCNKCFKKISNICGPEDGHEPCEIVIKCDSCGQGFGLFECEIKNEQ